MYDGCMLQNGVNTIIVNVFLSTKLNGDHQVDMMDMFQSKDFVICALHMPFLSSFSHTTLHLMSLPSRIALNEVDIFHLQRREQM